MSKISIRKFCSTFIPNLVFTLSRQKMYGHNSAQSVLCRATPLINLRNKKSRAQQVARLIVVGNSVAKSAVAVWFGFTQIQWQHDCVRFRFLQHDVCVRSSLVITEIRRALKDGGNYVDCNGDCIIMVRIVQIPRNKCGGIISYNDEAAAAYPVAEIF